MPRSRNQNIRVYAEPTKAERIRVYRDRDCRAIFSEFDNARLRQRKAITSVVGQHNLWVPGFSTERLITVLRSLQKDDIFGSPYSARLAFPELFPPQERKPPVPAVAPDSVSIRAQADMAPASQPQRDLYTALENLYSTGTYSDLIVSSAAKSYSVHRAVVCPRSVFLAAACRNPFKEASDGVITLPDDEPCVIDMMIQYFYRLDYRQSPDPENLSQSPEQQQNNPADVSSLLLHAKVYAVAEKYGVSGLKDLAVAKFKTAVTHSWDTTDFLDATSEAYSSTIDKDRGLRDVVIEVFAEHEELLDRDEVKAVIKGLGLLAFDLLVYLHQERKIRY